MKKISILGKDARSENLRKLYEKENITLVNYAKAEYVIAPIPFTRDNVYITYDEIRIDELIFSMKKNKAKLLITGNLNATCIEKLERNDIKYIDVMKSEVFVSKNAFATAEGTIKLIMENIYTTLEDAKILIIGYGRISKKLVKLLKSFNNSYMSVIVRRKEILDELLKENINAKMISEIKDEVNKYDVIINTVPAIILNKDVLQNINKETFILDVASNPGGIDYMEAEKLKLNTMWALGIPSKYSPVSAAKYLKEEIDKKILF